MTGKYFTSDIWVTCIQSPFSSLIVKQSPCSSYFSEKRRQRMNKEMNKNHPIANDLASGCKTQNSSDKKSYPIRKHWKLKILQIASLLKMKPPQHWSIFRCFIEWLYFPFISTRNVKTHVPFFTVGYCTKDSIIRYGHPLVC